VLRYVNVVVEAGKYYGERHQSIREDVRRLVVVNIKVKWSATNNIHHI